MLSLYFYLLLILLICFLVINLIFTGEKNNPSLVSPLFLILCSLKILKSIPLTLRNIFRSNALHILQTTEFSTLSLNFEMNKLCFNGHVQLSFVLSFFQYWLEGRLHQQQNKEESGKRPAGDRITEFGEHGTISRMNFLS